MELYKEIEGITKNDFTCFESLDLILLIDKLFMAVTLHFDVKFLSVNFTSQRSKTGNITIFF